MLREPPNCPVLLYAGTNKKLVKCKGVEEFINASFVPQKRFYDNGASLVPRDAPSF
ncbi:MAG: hypothetical protein K2P04_03310 [Oscillospiraceae bacterium]|nr:hypothetical protein [Oscillospiraceae bacterium]